uniref:Uncharacterized protein n=1 Tax=Tetranychus urticae TaxID=32264 RepID=T1KFF6_TETUR
MDQCQRMLFDFSHSQVMDIIFTIKDITFHSNENIMLFVGSGNSQVPEFDVKVTHYPMNEQKT